MTDDQPEASSSTSTLAPLHLAAVVFDSGLSREQYVKLIGRQSLVHVLVQRLMEKHGSDKHVN